MILRAEKPSDYNQIAELNFWAFTNWKPRNTFESEMVALARQSADFDPELSIVAEENGSIIGHVLLVTTDFIVLGEKAKGVLLGPVAVNPEHQKNGIGKELIEKGHAVAKSKGYEFSLLCGHPEYYPKFGYLQNVFAVSGTKIEKKEYKHNTLNNMAFRPLLKTDVDIVCSWQKEIRKKDSLAIIFENNIVGLHTNSPTRISMTILKDDVPVGYIKCMKSDCSNIDALFFDKNHIEDILLFLYKESKANILSLNQPPEIFIKILSDDKFSISDERGANKAFMICPLDSHSVINKYCEDVVQSNAPLGVVSYPPYYDVDL